MGSLAVLAKNLGHTVTGSDANVYPPMSTQLEAQGIQLMQGYDPSHLEPAPDLVVVGNAMSRGNPAVEYVLNKARHVGVVPRQGVEALSAFKSVKRRMEKVAEVRGITIYDDFAHHPTAIATTLDGLRKKVGQARIIAIVEPRSNSMKLGAHRDGLPESVVQADQPRRHHRAGQASGRAGHACGHHEQRRFWRPAWQACRGAAMSGPERITLAMTGASGAQYGLRLLDCLVREDREVHFLISKAAQLVMATETDVSLPPKPQMMQAFLTEYTGAEAGQIRVYGKEDWMSPVASGSGSPSAMVVVPCSTGTLSAIATGACNNLIERAADVTLKERRQLIIVPREAPFSSIHLEHMLKLSNMGVVILPASPGFYHQPQTIDDLVDFVVARILNLLNIPQDMLPRWGEHHYGADE
nr:UDP-N-acetylmuramate--L-alanine ligase-like [Tanacetum cinerariifolium]